MLAGLAQKLLGTVLDKRLPAPSSEENVLLAELRAAFRELPVFDTANVPSQAAWLSNMNQLRELVLNQDPRRFLRWEVVSNAMFVSFARYLAKELNYLKHRPDWRTRWDTAIEESSVGHPIPYIFHPTSSGNLIHHAYHLAQFEEKTEVSIADVDFVFEFGGGYGSMCRLFHNLGFRGRYIIFDLPSFSALQVYFLRSLGLPVRSSSDVMKTGSGIICISDLQQLTTLLADQVGARKSLFLATWSISETPLSIRESILPLVSRFQAFLIAYQDRFGEVDNVDFFGNWKETLHNVAWRNWRIEHIPGNSYLFGRADSIL